MRDQEVSIRAKINAQAGHCHTLSRRILGLDWYDTESQARRVIEYFADLGTELPKGSKNEK